MNEHKDKMLMLLTQVDDIKAKEAAFLAEKQRHQDDIAKSEAELKRTESDIKICRKAELDLQGELTKLWQEIFFRPEEEKVVFDESHVVTDGSAPSVEEERHKIWRDREKQLRSV